jgi:hypothetical protein
MALAVTLLGSTFNTTAGSKTVTATPALGDLIVVLVAATGVASGLGISDNNGDGHGTYEQIVSSLKNTSADQMVAFVRSDAIQKAASTVWTTSGDSASTGGGLFVCKITGATIAGPAFIRQSGAQNNGAAAATPTDALSVAALTTNALLSAVFNATNPAGTTVPTSWTSLSNTGYATPTTGLICASINSGFTGSSVTWGGTSATAYCSLALEMRADAGQTSLNPPRGSGALDIALDDSPQLQAVKRSAYYMQKWQKRRSGLFAPEPGILVPA